MRTCIYHKPYLESTLSARLFPALNLTTFLAGIATSSPVLGFLPVLAGVSFTSNFPHPIKLTSSPFTNVSSNKSNNVFSFLSASAFVSKFPFTAYKSTNSFFFISLYTCDF